MHHHRQLRERAQGVVHAAQRAGWFDRLDSVCQCAEHGLPLHPGDHLPDAGMDADASRHGRAGGVSTLLPSDQADVNYVLFIGRGDQGKDHAAYRADRMLHLRSRCIAAKAVRPERRFVIGIALDARGVRGSSEDFIFWDTADWTEESILRAQKLREELGYFQPGQVIESQMIEDEYPSVRTTKNLAALADELSRLTLAESTQLAEMLRDRWTLA